MNDFESTEDWSNHTGNENLDTPMSWTELTGIEPKVIFPELIKPGKDLIEHFLGYLPSEELTEKVEPFLRVLIQQRRLEQISSEQFGIDVGQYLKVIRNNDAHDNLLNVLDDFEEEFYKSYKETQHLPHARAARQRLIDILGYEPQLRHSLIIELWLSEVMSRDTIRFPDDRMTPIDHRAITMIRYREVLLAKGKKFADDWPILINEPHDFWEDGNRRAAFSEL